jgi:hypothetical protein
MTYFQGWALAWIAFAIVTMVVLPDDDVVTYSAIVCAVVWIAADALCAKLQR